MLPYEIAMLAFATILVIALIGFIVIMSCLIVEAIKERSWYWIVFIVFSALAVGVLWINQDIAIQVTFDKEENTNGKY